MAESVIKVAVADNRVGLFINGAWVWMHVGAANALVVKLTGAVMLAKAETVLASVEKVDA